MRIFEPVIQGHLYADTFLPSLLSSTSTNFTPDNMTTNVQRLTFNIAGLSAFGYN